MDSLQIKLCDIQGRLFVLSGESGYNSIDFLCCFMNGDVARRLDSSFDRMQWAGEEYLLEEVIAEAGNQIKQDGEVFSGDLLFWCGYVYRFWHYHTGEPSNKIYRQAPAATMKRNYMMFHTQDPIIAIEDLKEIYNQRKAQKAK